MALFTNYATLSYNGHEINSNTVTGELLETLSATKTAAASDYSPGGDVSYVVSLVNSGTTELSGLTLSDDLGGYEFNGTTVYPLAYQDGSIRYYVNGVPQAAPALTPGAPLVVTGVSVPAGGSALLVYETAVTAFAPPTAGGSILNTVTITGSGLAAPVTAEATLDAAEGAALSVTKAVSPTAVAPNGELSYSFTLENRGNTAVTAGENATLSDLFDPILSGITVTLDGAAWARGVNYSYDETTGQFATLPGQLAIPAASYTQNSDGSYTVEPGSVTLSVSGTLQS